VKSVPHSVTYEIDRQVHEYRRLAGSEPTHIYLSRAAMHKLMIEIPTAWLQHYSAPDKPTVTKFCGLPVVDVGDDFMENEFGRHVVVIDTLP